MTRLMSVWTSAISPATSSVSAPVPAAISSIVRACSKIACVRAIR